MAAHAPSLRATITVKVRRSVQRAAPAGARPRGCQQSGRSADDEASPGRGAAAGCHGSRAPPGRSALRDGLSGGSAALHHRRISPWASGPVRELLAVVPSAGGVAMRNRFRGTTSRAPSSRPLGRYSIQAENRPWLVQCGRLSQSLVCPPYQGCFSHFNVSSLSKMISLIRVGIVDSSSGKNRTKSRTAKAV